MFLFNDQMDVGLAFFFYRLVTPSRVEEEEQY